MLKKLLCCLLAALTLCAPVLAEEEAAFDMEKPKIALTFDDGPTEHTPELLEILAENGVRATFFMVGNNMTKMPETVTAAHDAGHEIGMHTWGHERLTELTDERITNNLKRCQECIVSLTGEEAKWMRPPYGSVGTSTYTAARRLGLYIVRWSLDSNDWSSHNPDKICEQILANVKDGEVILCHDTHPATLEAMRRLLPMLKEEGYQFLTVSELFSLYDVELKSTAVYWRVPPEKMKKK